MCISSMPGVSLFVGMYQLYAFHKTINQKDSTTSLLDSEGPYNIEKSQCRAAKISMLIAIPLLTLSFILSNSSSLRVIGATFGAAGGLHMIFNGCLNCYIAKLEKTSKVREVFLVVRRPNNTEVTAQQ